MDQFVKPVGNLICLFCANPPQPVFSPPPIKSFQFPIITTVNAVIPAPD